MDVGAELLEFLMFVVAMAALALAIGASSRSRQVEREVRELGTELGRLRELVRRRATPAGPPPAPPEEAQAPAAQPSAPATAGAGVATGKPDLRSPALPGPEVRTVPAPAVPSPTGQAAKPAGAPAPPATVWAAPPGDGGQALEQRIGVTWFTRVGAATVVLGAAYFFKIAVDRGWLGPWGRVLLGMLGGAALVAVAERIRNLADRRYVQALLGVGLALLYVAGYAAYGFYRLVPLSVAFLGLAVVALFGGALANRHRAEVILLISLAAALANPILLSTGEDRALALFAYLLVMTTATLAVSAWRGFLLAPWLALAGVAVLFIGWHTRFFVDSPPLLDAVTGAALPATAGPYWPLAARAVPLGAVAAFAAQWIGLAWLSRRREGARVEPLAAMLAGVVVLHAGAASLLSNRPVALAVAMAVGGAVSIAVVRAREERPWLVAPFAVSFFILTLSGRLETSDVTPVLLVGGAWVGLYLASLAAAARPDGGDRVGRAALVALAVATTAAVVLAASWLLPAHPLGLALAALVLAGAASGLAAASRAGWLAAPAAAASAVALVVAAAPVPPLGGAFLALAAGLAGLYLASAAHSMLARRDLSGSVVLTGAGAPLGLVAVVVSATAVSAYGLRAVFCAGSAVAVFALGAVVLRRVPEGRNAAAVLLTTGVGLAALAVGLALSGVTITLAWSLMAVAVVLVALRERDPRFLTVGLLLFGVVLVRLLAVDVVVPIRNAELFEATAGAEGAFRATPFVNARSLGLGGAALALLFTARAVARSRERWSELRGLAGGLAGLGYLLLIALAVTEATGLATQLPTIPRGLAPEAFRAALAAARRALADQVPRRAAVATLTLGISGGGLLVAGFATRSVFHRWAGLAVLAATIVKLGSWDIWSLPTPLRVVVLLGIGALLLAVGYLYARLGPRLLGLLKVAGVAALLLVPGGAECAVDPGSFRSEAVVTVEAGGLSRFDVTPALYRAARDPLAFSDLRVTEGGVEVPWVLRDFLADGIIERRRAPMFDPVVLPGGASRADFDAGNRPHSAIELEVAASANFLRDVTVEVSDDRHGWGKLASATIYRVTIGNATASGTTLTYPESISRWVRVTIAAQEGQEPVTIKGGTLGPGVAVEVPVGVVDLGRPAPERIRNGHGTVFTTGLAEPGVPLRAIVSDVRTPRFERHVTIEGANSDGVFAWAGDGVLLKAGAAENRRLGVRGTWARWRLVVDDGDDPPLEISSLSGEYRRQEIVVDSPPGTLRLLVGTERAEVPSYDLGATLAKQGHAPVKAAVLGAVHPNPDYNPTVRAGATQAWSERYRTVIGIALALLLAALALAAYRLLQPTGTET